MVRGGKTTTDKRKKETVREEEERDRRTRDDRDRERERETSALQMGHQRSLQRGERGPGGLGSENNAPRQWRGAPPHRLGLGRRGWGEDSHLQVYPTGQRRVNDGGRAGCPGQEAPRQGERESRVSQSSSPPPPSPPPPPRPPTTDHRQSSQGSSTQQGGGSEPHREGGTKNGQPHPDCTEGAGGHRDQLGGRVWPRTGCSWWLALGEGTGEGQAGEGGQEGLLVSMVSLPMGCAGGEGGRSRRSEGPGGIGGRRACADTRILGTYDQTR